MTYLTIPLNPSFNKQDFRCGNSLLDMYLHKQANQDVKRKLAVCFVYPDEHKNIIGYYTLSNASIAQLHIPDEFRKRLPPSYQDVPATLLGRLAVDQTQKGKGIGEILLMDALKRSFDAAMYSVASMSVIVDPIDAQAELFYKKYGFIKLGGSGKMFLPMKTISSLF